MVDVLYILNLQSELLPIYRSWQTNILSMVPDPNYIIMHYVNLKYIYQLWTIIYGPQLMDI